jgi:ArsR family transcriptional regulator
MNLEQALSQLEAAAEPSRLRLLALLLPGEATVGDLVEVLGQSQPRVSRHLRLLAEAGLVESFREGRSIYYRLADVVLDDGIGDYLGALLRDPDPTVSQDRQRMLQWRRQREREALRRGSRMLRPGASTPQQSLAESLDTLLGTGPLGEVLDVGAGAGHLLNLLVARAQRVVGVDTSATMRQLARSRLHGARRWTIRDAEAAALPFADGQFDLVILDEVLAASLQPEQILREVRRVLGARGRLLVLDRILPVVRALPGAPAREELSEPRLVTLLRTAGFAVQGREWLPGRVPDRALFLAVMIDVADAPQEARTGTHG